MCVFFCLDQRASSVLLGGFDLNHKIGGPERVGSKKLPWVISKHLGTQALSMFNVHQTD